MQIFKSLFVSFSGIIGIEFLDISVLPEIIKFGGQSLIGILTIYYLYLKIKKVKHEKNI
jgi:hypothetical protein